MSSKLQVVGTVETESVEEIVVVVFVKLTLSGQEFSSETPEDVRRGEETTGWV